jgi:PIN domain nuclease of toxin-antitoxin system
LKAAKLIWKIFCIVKWNVWLVWESSVKAKIEQLTQRTYEVKWIDQIMDFTNLSIAPIHHYWLDYEISAYVDLQFDF